jgi:hypothetical protein
MSKKKTLGSKLASMRWAKPDADRDQPREAGKLGGRPRSCNCGKCVKCKWRVAQAKSRANRKGKQK